MRFLLKTLVTLALLAGILLGGYWFYRRGLAKKEGKEYAFRDAPGDLLRDVAAMFERSPEEPKSTPKAEPPPAGKTDEPAPDEPAAPPPDEPGLHEPGTGEPGAAAPADGPDAPDAPDLGPAPVDPLTRASDLMDEGKYEQAGRLLSALDGREARDLLERARLFALLLEDHPAGGAVDGPDALATLTMPGGQSLLVRVTDEDDDSITILKGKGLRATVEKSKVKDLTVARTAEEKRKLADAEYVRRHRTALTSGALLDLARFCRTYGLDDHVTYLLNKAREATGDGVEAALAEKFSEAEQSANTPRMRVIGDLMTRFFPGGRHASEIAAAMPVPEPVRVGGPGGTDEPAAGSAGSAGGSPPSGIAGTNWRHPRQHDTEGNDLYEKAQSIRRKADRLAKKARPGMEDAARYRKEAIAAYREAIALYEKVEQRWGMSLESTFSDLSTRLYQLLKDSR